MDNTRPDINRESNRVHICFLRERTELRLMRLNVSDWFLVPKLPR